MSISIAENVICGRISLELISWGLKFQPKPKMGWVAGRVEFDVCELFAYELKNSGNIILANRESGTHLIIRKLLEKPT